MSEHNENFNKEVKIIKKNQTEIMNLKAQKLNWKNPVEKFNTSFEKTEEWINYLEKQTI